MTKMLTFATLGVGLLFPGGACAAPENPPRPTVILICVDTLRADHIGSYGYKRKTTPNIDAFAEDSVLFEHFYAAASWTTPSHMSMFTSMLPSEHQLTRLPKEFRLGATLNAFWKTLRAKGAAGLYERYYTDKRRYQRKKKEGVVTLAGAFKGAGYRTGAFVASRFLSPEYGFAAGFEEYSWEHFINGEDRAEKALSFLEKSKAPAFVFLHLYDAHGDLGLITQDRDCAFTGPVFKVPPPFAGAFSSGTAKGYFDGTFDTLIPLLRENKFSKKDAAYLTALYDDGILHTDRIIGEFISRLKERGLYDKSLIVLVSDHGEALGEKLEVGHNCAFTNGVLHVPLIVKLPGSERAGTRDRAAAGGIDLMPTVLAAAGTEPGAALKTQMKGRNLLAPERKRTPPPIVFSETDCYEYSRVYRGAMDAAGWKLLYNISTGEKSLHNVFRDPLEENDACMEEPAKAGELEEAIAAKYLLGE